MQDKIFKVKIFEVTPTHKSVKICSFEIFIGYTVAMLWDNATQPHGMAYSYIRQKLTSILLYNSKLCHCIKTKIHYKSTFTYI